MPCAWMAIIEIAFSVATEPMIDFTCGARQAETAEAGDFDFDQIAILGAVAHDSASTCSSSPRFSIGMMRTAAVGRCAEDAERGVACASSRTLMMRAV